jgi:drug/metabolite transporter (DMT)-like permease
MPHLINEKKAFLAICFISVAILMLAQIKLFAAPVLDSEKGLGLLLLAIILLASGFVLVTKAIRRV